MYRMVQDRFGELIGKVFWRPWYLCLAMAARAECRVRQTSSCAGHKSMPLKAKRPALTRERFNIHTGQGRQNKMDLWQSRVGFGDLAVASNDMISSGFRFARSRRSAMGIARRNGDWYAVVASRPPQSDCRAICVCVVVTWGPSTSFCGARSSLVSRD